MVHQGQRLALGFEAGDHITGVHPRLDDLEGNFPANRLLLLGDENKAKAPGADLLHEHVRSDRRAGTFARRFIHRNAQR